jgi:glycerophosphoryl diester phosphodiesterase
VDLTTAQLRTLDCGKLLAAYPDAEVVHGNRIATLPEVFALADSYGAQVRYNIETKVEADAPEKSAPPQRFVEVILAAVRAANKTPYVEIQSFDWRTLPMVRAADPTIPLVALWDDTTWVPGSPWLNGVDPAVITDPIEGVLAVGADVASPNYKLVNAALIQRAHAAGLTVVPWTVNDADSMNALIDLGVDGLITDYPTLLRQVMAERGMPLPPAYQRRT